jgi:D-alanyl-D-alanine carboxypeptidase
MTTYVVLSALREGRVTPDTPLLYTARAQAEPPSKMGFPVNTIITVDNALKILMVKSANDLAVTLAEGVGGSVDAFVAEMNRTAQGLGMTQSRFKNPNGWHDPEQVTSARDMAILGRALYRDFPQSAGLYDIGAVQLGNRLIKGHNALISRFPGADGMKTGFTCPSGFNLVASARRGKRHLIAVVLGYSSAAERTDRAAELLDAGFGKWTFWRTGQDVATLPVSNVAAPNLRAEVCEKKKGVAPEAVGEVEGDDGSSPVARNETLSGLITSGYASEPKQLLFPPAPVVPVRVFLGPNPNGPPELIALASKLSPLGAIANESEEPPPLKLQKKPEPKAAKKPDKKPQKAAQAEPAAKPAAAAVPAPAKPASATKPPAAKAPAAKPAAKPKQP